MALNLQKRYDQMREQALRRFAKGEFEYDPWINSREDTRYGLTLLARPGKTIKKKILELLESFREKEPG